MVTSLWLRLIPLLVEPLVVPPPDGADAVTRTMHSALTSPTEAVTVAVPLFTAVTVPFSSTVATDESVDVQVSVAPEPAGETFAVSVHCSPMLERVKSERLSEIEFTVT